MHIDEINLWNNCLERLRSEIVDIDIFNAYINPLQLAFESNELVIYAHNDFVRRYVDDNYLDTISTHLRSLSANNSIGIRIVTGTPQATKPKTTIKSSSKETIDFSDLKSDYVAPKFNPLFTFENFVLGESNHYARSAALAVVESLGDPSHNPLMIYGKTGLGKTHLMHSIGIEVTKRYPHYKIAMIQSERFMRDMVSSIENKKMEEFKKKYRSLDLLMIDDIHTMSSRDATQQEFLNTFNSLVDDGKQIVIIGNAFPDKLTNLSLPMQSRLKGGLTVEIKPPCLKMRKDILQSKIKQRMQKENSWEIILSDEMAEYVATRIYGSVRDLEGAVNILSKYLEFSHEHIVTEDNIVNALKDRFISHDHIFTVGNIQKIAAEYFDVSIEDIKSPSKKSNIVRARHLAMALVRDKMNRSMTEIGRDFGGRDHTTILHALKTVEKKRHNDVSFNEDYLTLEQQLTP